MYIHFFSFAVLICVSPGTIIDAAPTLNSSVSQELTPPPIHGVRGSSTTATDVVFAPEGGRRTKCLDKLILNLTEQGKKRTIRRFKRKIRICDKLSKRARRICRQEAAASKEKQLQNFKIDYAVVRDRCGGACFQSEELKEAFVAYTQGSADERRQMQFLHGKIAIWPTCLATDLDGLMDVESDNYYDQLFSDFNGDLSSWEVSSVTSLKSTFANTIAFDSDISAWDVSSVKSMIATFFFARAFNGDISSWDVSSVTSLILTFYNAAAFDGNISAWDVSSVTSMRSTFDGAQEFDGDISSWDISSVTSLFSTTYKALKFNSDISAWDVSSITSLKKTFYNAIAFDGDLFAWDVSSVVLMDGTFAYAKKFNRNISAWDTSNVSETAYMFFYAKKFNCNISAWDTSNVSETAYMFYYAEAFNQCLEWSLNPDTETRYMFEGSGGRMSSKC